MKTGVIVGRFQVAELHRGHKHLIETARKENDLLVVVLGSSGKKSKREPLAGVLRQFMIHSDYPKAVVHHIEDCESDEEWSANLDKILDTLPEPTLYGSRDSFIPHYKGKYTAIEVSEIPDVSGTQERKNFTIDDFKSAEFRKGIIYAVQNYFKE